MGGYCVGFDEILPSLGGMATVNLFVISQEIYLLSKLSEVGHA